MTPLTSLGRYHRTTKYLSLLFLLKKEFRTDKSVLKVYGDFGRY